MSRRSRSLVWSYIDLPDPNRVFVVPGGFSRIQVANISMDWGATIAQVGMNLIGTVNTAGIARNTRWLTPGSRLYTGNATTPTDITQLYPTQYFESFSTTYATSVPAFVSLVIEGVDAPDGRVAVLTPANSQISLGQAGVVFNIVDKNLKMRLLDPFGRNINNITFTVTLTLLE